MALAEYERDIADAVSTAARGIACALPPNRDVSDRAYRAAATNDIVKALARHDLKEVAALALGVEMALAHRAAHKCQAMNAP